MKKVIISVLMIISAGLSAQSQGNQLRYVLFLGNSYTAANNLPQMLSDIALSTGNTVVFNSNTPGGYTLQAHSTNQETLSLIESVGWDLVVLQEQSQLPALPIEQVEHMVFPFARKLDSLINISDPCVETLFYMTWGRKNGDSENCPQWPPVCTYEGMDSLLALRYRMMADSNMAILAPVGRVWHYLRTFYPGIELYASDGSHPSVAGTYAAALSFYTAIFRQDPILVTYNASLDPETAGYIRNAVRLVVYDSLTSWNIGLYDPAAGFNAEVNGFEVSFANSSLFADQYEWDFGDGTASALPNPVHIYNASGDYEVRLVAGHCNMSDIETQVIHVLPTGIEMVSSSLTRIFPNPGKGIITVSGRNGFLKGYSSELMAIDGRMIIIRETGTMTDSLTMDVTGVQPGIYLLKVKDLADNTVLIQKVIISAP
jgi:hypothetical protein